MLIREQLVLYVMFKYIKPMKKCDGVIVSRNAEKVLDNFIKVNKYAHSLADVTWGIILNK